MLVQEEYSRGEAAAAARTPDTLQMKGRTALRMPIWEPVKPCSFHSMPRYGSRNTIAAFCRRGVVGGEGVRVGETPAAAGVIDRACPLPAIPMLT